MIDKMLVTNPFELIRFENTIDVLVTTPLEICDKIVMNGDADPWIESAERVQYLFVRRE